MRPFSQYLYLPLASFLPLMVAGCSLSSTASPSPDAGFTIQGTVHGGQQPIVGAHVYLFAANTNGYAGPGIAASTSNASVSVLNVASTGNSDSVGAYVLTSSTGAFSISGDYSCTPNTQVYVYALGGSSGAGANSSSGLLAALGGCPSPGNFLTATPFISINEVSTIAAAYAFAGFATDATHVASSGTALAQIGIKNSFANALNLASISTGIALAVTPAGNGTVPQSEINTLSNILASCVNSSGAVTGPTKPTTCYTLFNDAQSNGNSGVIPGDTATAAINIAHNPGINTAALYALGTPTPPFGPALTSAPNDFSIALNFTGGGLYSAGSLGIAVDGFGNAWVSGLGVVELSPSGSFLSGANGYSTGGPAVQSGGIAIDTSENVWSAAAQGAVELSNSGTILSGAQVFVSGGYIGVAIDGSGEAWLSADRIVLLSSSGSVLSGSLGYGYGTGQNHYTDLAVDGSGNAWAGNFSDNGVVKFSNSGSVLSGANGYSSSGHPNGIAIDSAGNAWVASPSGDAVTKLSNSGSSLFVVSGGANGIGIDGPWGIAIDGAGNAWVANYYLTGISEISSTGTILSGPNGYINAALYYSSYIALDGSGDAWVANSDGDVTEFIGVAVPVITPIAAGLPTTPTASGTSNLGTRP
jgi:hypothetical protein